MSIENYKTDLAPLLHGFKDETVSYRDNKRTFTDQFSNSICFNYGKSEVLKLVKDPSLITVDVFAIDKGYLSYTVYQHLGSYFILYQTRCDLDGWCGHYTSFVVVPSLEVISQFFEKTDKKRKVKKDANMVKYEGKNAADSFSVGNVETTASVPAAKSDAV